MHQHAGLVETNTMVHVFILFVLRPFEIFFIPIVMSLAVGEVPQI